MSTDNEIDGEIFARPEHDASESEHPEPCHAHSMDDGHDACNENSEIAFGALPDLSNASLPPDAGSQAFLDAVRALKPSFTRREDFSAFLCTQIAARGIIPNASLVSSIGGWGSKGHVSQDVKAWYAQVARRSVESEIALPASLRRPALQLIESLWMLAARQAQGYIEADRGKASRAHLALQAEIKEAREQMLAAETLLQKTVDQRDAAVRLCEDLRSQMGASEQRCQIAVAKLDAERTAFGHKEDALRAQHRCDLERDLDRLRENLRMEHHEALEQLRSSMQEGFQAQLDATERARVQDVGGLKQRLQEVESALQAAKSQALLSAQDAEAALQQSRHMALALDKARQEALAAVQQAFEAQRAQTAAASESAEMRIRISMLERDLALERAHAQRLRQDLDRALADLLLARKQEGERKGERTPASQEKSDP